MGSSKYHRLDTTQSPQTWFYSQDGIVYPLCKRGLTRAIRYDKILGQGNITIK